VESFTAVLVAADRGGAYVKVPSKVVTALGGAARIPVQATFNGIAYRGSIVSMGGDTKVLGVLKSIRTELGVSPGDRLTVTVERDDAERVVTVPDDLAAALDAANLRDAFAALSYSHQREYVTWLDEARRSDTRARRVAETVERLDVGANRPDT
jgi:bifunctional DNA-binding transcriptional regulator/antitoxin component of YhaV-PrlF toxin-antitoxin module